MSSNATAAAAAAVAVARTEAPPCVSFSYSTSIGAAKASGRDPRNEKAHRRRLIAEEIRRHERKKQARTKRKLVAATGEGRSEPSSPSSQSSMDSSKLPEFRTNHAFARPMPTVAVAIATGDNLPSAGLIDYYLSNYASFQANFSNLVFHLLAGS